MSPFTAPFSTCSLTAPEAPHGLPFERAIHKDLYSKLDETSTMSLALAEQVLPVAATLEAIGASLLPGL